MASAINILAFGLLLCCCLLGGLSFVADYLGDWFGGWWLSIVAIGISVLPAILIEVSRNDRKPTEDASVFVFGFGCVLLVGHSLIAYCYGNLKAACRKKLFLVLGNADRYRQFLPLKECSALNVPASVIGVAGENKRQFNDDPTARNSAYISHYDGDIDGSCLDRRCHDFSFIDPEIGPLGSLKDESGGTRVLPSGVPNEASQNGIE